MPAPAKAFFLFGAAWVKSRAERPSVSGVNRQLHVQIGCKLGIRNRKDELTKQAKRFFLFGAAWVKSRAERPSVSGVNRQLHVQIGCKLGIRNRKDELTKQAKRNKLQIKPEGN